MVDLAYYKGLPDGMDPADVAAEFDGLLTCVPLTDESDEVVEALLELADRQWHTYQLIDNALAERIKFKLIVCWRDSDPARANWLFHIAGYLGARGFVDFIRTKPKELFSTLVEEEVQHWIRELEEENFDPYWSFRH